MTSSSTRDAVSVEPARALRGEAPALPGDKSISHRALIFAALAEGESTIANLAPGRDVASTAAAVAALGAQVERTGSLVRMIGRPWRAPDGVLDCGNSGTTMRLLTGALAGRGVAATLDGDASLRTRPMRRIAEPLATLGARIDTTDGHAPIIVHGALPLRGGEHRLAIASAQVATSVALAALGAVGRTTIVGGLGARDHTERLLPFFGAQLTRSGDALSIEGPQRLHGAHVDVPGDPSAAAFWLGAAAVVPGSRITVRHCSLNPTRLGFVRALSAMGAAVELHEVISAPEPIGSITLTYAPLHGITVDPDDVAGIIDELPLLGAIAAYASGTTSVRGAAELRVKESDRIATLVAGLTALGVAINAVPDGFDVHGGAVGSGRVDAAGDHRLAMAFAIAALGARGPVMIDAADCVAISHPTFFAELEALRA